MPEFSKQGVEDNASVAFLTWQEDVRDQSFGLGSLVIYSHNL
jgi:hypothetical protein